MLTAVLRLAFVGCIGVGVAGLPGDSATGGPEGRARTCAQTADPDAKCSNQDGDISAVASPEAPAGLAETPAASSQGSRPQSQPGASGTPAATKNLKVHGYVTAVLSPTEFEVEDYRITRDQEFVLNLENASDNLNFRPEDIRVGVELEIKGAYNPSTGELKARSISVDLEQFKKIKQRAVLSRPPEGLEKTDGHWTGVCFADGQRIRIGPNTQLVFGLTKKERDRAKRQQAEDNPTNEDDAGMTFQPLASLAEVTLGTVMTYEGKRSRTDGVIDAERVEFVHNDLEKGEKSLRDSLKMESTAFDDGLLRPGELKIRQVGKFKTLPDSEVQEYVTGLGRRLIPRYQTQLPDDDSNKIAFSFFVVIDKRANAFATPNGIIVVNSGLFDVLENEAQLAFILGHEISHAVQEHTWRQREYHKKKLTVLAIGGAFAAGLGQYGLSDMATMIEGAVRSGYARNLENQADRLGLEYMVSAGYDPRQAPAVWKLMARKVGDSPTNLFWSSHDNHSTRRSYLMNELKNNYSDVPYSATTVEEPRFHAIAERVRSRADQTRKTRVK